MPTTSDKQVKGKRNISPEAKARQLANLRPNPAWVKGQSGNPKGAPLKLESEAVRTREFLDTIDESSGLTRGEVIRETKYQLAVAGNMSAIESLETRAYGKPADTLKLENNSLPPAGYLAILGLHGIQAEPNGAIDVPAEPLAIEGETE